MSMVNIEQESADKMFNALENLCFLGKLYGKLATEKKHVRHKRVMKEVSENIARCLAGLPFVNTEDN